MNRPTRYVCPVCGWTGKQKQLRYHVISHLGEKCPVCGKKVKDIVKHLAKCTAKDDSPSTLQKHLALYYILRTGACKRRTKNWVASRETFYEACTVTSS